jgi:hypothetical protein
LLEDLALAMGPNGFVVCEDFILGHGDPGRVGSSGRDGLSPVRLGSRLEDRFYTHGLWNGDAWRQWQGHGWRGVDDRGWTIESRDVPSFYDRARSVAVWREHGKNLLWPGCSTGSVWGGGGHKLLFNYPAGRYWLKAEGSSGLPKTHKEWLDRRRQWVKAQPHGMDALLHLHSVARRIGVDIKGEPKRIYDSVGYGVVRVRGE